MGEDVGSVVDSGVGRAWQSVALDDLQIDDVVLNGNASGGLVSLRPSSSNVGRMPEPAVGCPGLVSVSGAASGP